MTSHSADDMRNAPFFIVGSGRSGSTLLRMIVSAHSRIAIPPETWFIIPLVENLPLDETLTREQLDRAIHIVTSHYRWPDMGMAAENFRDRVLLLVKPDLKEVIEVVYRYHLSNTGKERWGDKTPGYVHILPQLSFLYPAAKFLHLVRDGRDVTKSMQSAGWYGPWLHHCAKEWKDAIDQIVAHTNSPLSTRLLEVRYENLVVNTRETIERVCDFLGEEFQPGMLEWHEDAAARVPVREAHVHQKLTRNPTSGDVRRWEREMSPVETLIVESSLFRELTWMGYALRFAGPFWRPVLVVVALGCKTLLPLVSFLARVPRRLRRMLARALGGQSTAPPEQNSG